MIIRKYNNYRDFLADNIAKRLETNSELSTRWFSRSLNWPVSLINDVLARRRNLSTARLIELGSFLNLNSTDIEYLIFLGLQESNVTEVNEYFKKEIEIKSSFHSGPEANSFPTSLFNIEIQAVFMCLALVKNHKNVRRINELLYTFPELTELKISEIIEHLKKQNLIVTSGDSFKFTDCRFEVVFDGADSKNGAEFTKHYLNNLFSFISSEKKQGPGVLDNQLTALPNVKVEELKVKIVQLLNWVESVKVPLDAIDEKTTSLFQLSVSLFPIIDKKSSKSITQYETP